MEVKQMREVLKDAGVNPVPRSNKDVIALYNQKFSQTDIEDVVEKTEEKVVSIESTGRTFTYIGSGDEPPHLINFMGMQKFVRGQATKVSNPLVLAKISNNSAFVSGKIDSDLMFTRDEAEKKKANDQREKDRVMNERCELANKK